MIPFGIDVGVGEWALTGLLLLLGGAGLIGGVIGEARNFHQRFNFLVEIDGITYAGFVNCSELSAEFQMMEHYEGGAIVPEKQPTRLQVSDVTLERGAASGDNELYEWWLQTADVAAGGGDPSPDFKRTLDIIQLDRDNSELRRWTLYGAWIKKFTAGTWDNTSDDATIEQIVLAIDYFEQTFDSGPPGASA